MRGVSLKITDDHVPVLRVHYSADPAKDPTNPAGAVWFADALRGFVGGALSPRWRREMEIDYGALGGTLVFPNWPQLKGKVCPAPYTPQGERLYGVYDHGWRNPACFMVIGMDRDRRPIVHWQLYAPQVPVNDLAKIIKGETVRMADGRVFPGNPYWGQLAWIKADPSMWNEDQVQNDGTNKSVAYQFGLRGVIMDPGKRGGDTLAASWLTEMWRPERPGCCITCPPELLEMDATRARMGYAGPGAPCLVWEIGRLRFKDWSAVQSLHHDAKEEIEDKDNHAFDALKFHLHEFTPGAPTHPAHAPSGSLIWWRKQSARARQGLPVAAHHAQAARG